MNAYSYIRWSSDVQTDGDSLSRQTASTRKICKEKGWELDETTIGRDEGTSAFRGKNFKSGNLATFIQSVETKRIKTPCVLVIDDMSRLTRLPFKQARRHFEDLIDLGVVVCTADDGKVYDNTTFDSLFGILEPFMKIEAAHNYSAGIGRKLSAAWGTRQKEISEGKDRFGKLPFWLFRDKGTGQIKVNGEAAKVVSKIFEYYNEGMGVRGIADKLNSDKVTIFRGRKNGKTRWRTSTIQFVLKSPSVYGAFQNHKKKAGKRVPIGEMVENVLPVILPKSQVLLIWDKSTKRQKFQGRCDRSAVKNLFSGIIKCKHCGGSMVISGGTSTKNEYLVCCDYHFSKTCQRGFLNYRAVETTMSLFVCQAPNEYGEFLHTEPSPEYDGELQARKAEIVSVKNGIKRLIKLAAMTDSENVVEELNEMERKQKQLQEAVSNLEAHQRVMSQAPAEFEELRMMFVNAEKSRLLIREKFRAIVKQIVCDPPKNSFTIVWNSGRKPDVISLRSKFNGSKPSTWEYGLNRKWFKIGSLPRTNEQATQFLALLMNQQKVF